MTTETPPLVSLQAPKDVSIDFIEAELRQIWQTYSNSDDGLSVARATTFTFVVYEPEPTQLLLATLGFYTGPVDGIAGPRTTAAIKAAQKEYGLEVTGISNDALLQRLQGEVDRATAEGKLQEKALRSYAPDLAGSGIADAIAASNPCRIITLCPTVSADEGVQAQVSAYCPINKRNQNTLICCEYINLRGTAAALERVSGILAELMISGLPKLAWWKASPEPEYGLFKRLVDQCDVLIVDSSSFREPETSLKDIALMLSHGVPFADLNWSRLAAWQELTAEAFDPPERRSAIMEIDRVTIDYEQGNPSQALMYLSWVASRLQWKPVGFSREGGDYNLIRIKFVSAEQRDVEAELAGIPLADWGTVLGDLISIRLSSTNLNADCCTVLCSGTTGCMRMEAGGGAQSCSIQQVTPLGDQKTETLLSQQLLRSTLDVLYQDSMRIVYEILQLVT
jgi:glucose-6-phosphate dehydrogenase assembly protein OpcA